MKCLHPTSDNISQNICLEYPQPKIVYLMTFIDCVTHFASTMKHWNKTLISFCDEDDYKNCGYKYLSYLVPDSLSKSLSYQFFYCFVKEPCRLMFHM